MKKHCKRSGFCLPCCFVFNRHFYCFCKLCVLLKWQPSRACCVVLNKLSTLFDFVTHCKMSYFNISLDELLFIQVFEGNLQPSLEHLFIVKCSQFSISGGLSQPKNLKTPRPTAAFWCVLHLKKPLSFSNNSILLLKMVAAILLGNNPAIL